MTTQKDKRPYFLVFYEKTQYFTFVATTQNQIEKSGKIAVETWETGMKDIITIYRHYVTEEVARNTINSIITGKHELMQGPELFSVEFNNTTIATIWWPTYLPRQVEIQFSIGSEMLDVSKLEDFDLLNRLVQYYEEGNGTIMRKLIGTGEINKWRLK